MMWHEIKTEGYPPNGAAVLITDGKVMASAEYESYQGQHIWHGHGFGGYEWDWDFDEKQVTHWAELPPLPEMADIS